MRARSHVVRRAARDGSASASTSAPASSPALATSPSPPHRRHRQAAGAARAQQPRRRKSRAPAPPAPPPPRVDLAKLLTNQISVAPTLQQLERLAADNEPRLDSIHAAALLVRAAQLSMPPQALALATAPPGSAGGGGADAGADAAAIVARLAAIARARVGSFDAACACCALHSLAKLGVAADGDLAAALAARVAQLLDSCTPGQLATSLWALAKLGWRPPPGWLAGHLRACTAHMEGGHMAAHDLSLILYSLAVLGQRPSDAWLGGWHDAMRRALPRANAQDVSNALWALAALGAPPPAGAAAELLAAAQAAAPGASAQALSNALWAAARLRLAPPEAWVGAMLAAAAARLHTSATPQAFATTLAAVAELRLPHVAAPWLGDMLSRSLATLPAFKPPELAHTALALAKLSFRPPPEWVAAFLDAAAPHLTPPPPAPAAAADASTRAPGAAARGFTGPQLSNVLWALALLQCAPPAAWLGAALDALSPRLASLGSAQLSGVAWALAALGHVPPRAWLAAYLDSAFDRLMAEPAVFANTMFCLASLDVDGLQAWLERRLASAPAALSLAQYAELARVLEALALMDARTLRQAWVATSDADWAGDAVVPPQVEELMRALSTQDVLGLSAGGRGLQAPARSADSSRER